MLLIIIFIIGILGLVYAAYLGKDILKIEIKNKKVEEVANHIHKGALTFLNREYKIMAIFAVIVTAILYFTLENGKQLAISFVVGAVLSAIAGRIGMHIATKANSRTAEACEKNVKSGLKIAFSSGVVMGLTVVSLGILGVATFHYFFDDPELIFGLAFGASYIALFARVGGGIFTKAADVGADLVGKVEKGIPEDDPRNPAVIADNVGDNVGDVAGMGADLFESYAGSIIATISLAFAAGVMEFDVSTPKAILPLAIAGIGIISIVNIIGIIIGSFILEALN